MEHIIKAIKSTATIVLPTGVPARIDIKSPLTEHITDRMERMEEEKKEENV